MSEAPVEIISPSRPIDARLRPPSSKSITNRALICAALAEGATTLGFPLESDDTRVMIESLRRLGIGVDQQLRDDQPSKLIICGQGGSLPSSSATLFIGNSGTSVRFLTALVAAVGRGSFTLDGVERMRQRPIQDLLDALRELGAEVGSVHHNGCPPVVVQADGLRGGSVSIRGDVSSQFLSGLLMASPYATATTTIRLVGPLVSRPYVAMTVSVMRAFGVDVHAAEDHFVVPSDQRYIARHFDIEPDASAASYFWAAAAITGGAATVLGLHRDSLQGDVQFIDLLARMGCTIHESADGITVAGNSALQGIDCDMGDVSDTAQTLAAVALFASGPTTIRGIAHNRHKETDRIGNLAVELRKLGAVVHELPDGLRIEPPTAPHGALIETYDDHRMAMSLSLAGLRIPGVLIANPQCTAKTYPHFFRDLAAVTS